jgi:SAM-dependent methyltransferase
MDNHYDEKYFAWQRRLGRLGGLIDTYKFDHYISKNDVVLDFGCGGGYILRNLECKERFGIEINPFAIDDAKKNDIKVYKAIEDLPKSLMFDVIISNHALEHVENPYIILEKLRQRLRKGGKMICVVPIDDWRVQKRFIKDDINQHLYTWNPLLLGNLFTKAGYKVIQTNIISQVWLPFSFMFYKILPRPIYFFFCYIWSILTLNRQLRIIAERDKL